VVRKTVASWTSTASLCAQLNHSIELNRIAAAIKAAKLFPQLGDLCPSAGGQVVGEKKLKQYQHGFPP